MSGGVQPATDAPDTTSRSSTSACRRHSPMKAWWRRCRCAALIPTSACWFSRNGSRRVTPRNYWREIQRVCAICSRIGSPASPSSTAPCAASHRGAPQLLEAVRQLIGGRHQATVLDRLTPRECEVLELIAEGRSNSALAQHLSIAERAVEKHVSAIFSKLDLPPSQAHHRRVLVVVTYLNS